MTDCPLDRKNIFYHSFQMKLNNIFDAGKCEPFYQCLLNKTNNLLGEKCSRVKNSKVRLTGAAAASVTREKVKVFVIGKSGTPQCFKLIKNLPFRYCHQKKIT